MLSKANVHVDSSEADNSPVPRLNTKQVTRPVNSTTESATRKRKRNGSSENYRSGKYGTKSSVARSAKSVTFTEDGKNTLIDGSLPSPLQVKDQPPQQTKQGSSRDRSSLHRKAQELLVTRRALPVFSQAGKIRESLREPGKDALLLVGETGSGKSTQVPQILVNEQWAQRKTVTIDGKETKVGGCIAITEPRRVAAISLARRVAEEMGTPLGSSSAASQVGYSVRFDTSTSPSTKIKFLTEGMLLQELLRDPWLKEYSAVCVDEVHERGVNVDLILGFLKRLLDSQNEGRGGQPLKVVVMSATADMEMVKGFLESTADHPVPPLESQCNGKQTVDDGVTSNDASIQPKDVVIDRSAIPEVATCHIKGRQFPVNVIYSPAPVPDFIDAALTTIFTIHTKEPLPGDILVFLTGQETVENLLSLCHQYAMNLPPNVPKLSILPLFAALPQAAQQTVFEPTPRGHRKVILSTNIAETSVTVPGIRYVIDCGKHKRKQFRSRLSLDSLLVKPISKSSARQRSGRAGREAPGSCYRLYTESEYLKLDQDTSPEILRCDLSQAILTLKARGADDVWNFPLLTPPPREALEKALLSLLQLSALAPSTGKITDIGLKLARLPLSPRLGRVLLAATSYSVVPEVIDIISALSVESIFLSTTTEETTELAATARRELFRREGDHLTLLATVQAYVSENSNRRAWCEKRFVSHRAMQAVMDVRKQLQNHAKTSGLLASVSHTASENSDIGEDEKVASILKAFLTAFYPSTARLVPDGSYRTISGNQTVAIHPSSTLFGRGKVEAIMYNEFVYTNRAYARGVSAVQLNWVGDMFGGGV
ncbi:putative atp-dependent rna helicase [Phaeomoniella chlamydospora]|uniref:RNA helicase n=1 Tax=Phaeomoniella chlamydospora TaxID=158046 RepID=A0A0G2ENM2_PHACM|nr:putative atp-dependent rna helicase [Phaeomoniella chlamydospora]